MYSPLRLSLKIPDSPIEKQAFRSRSFRRIVFSACALSLLLATIRSIHLQNEIHRQFSLDYLSLYHHGRSSDSNPLTQPAEGIQTPFEMPEDTTDDDSPHAISSLMNQLPEVIHIPFEEAVADVELEGWEDSWFSSATYDFDRGIAEPKLDFVYNCEYTTHCLCTLANACRGQRIGRRIQEYQA
jgi:hypothetical protein